MGRARGGEGDRAGVRDLGERRRRGGNGQGDRRCGAGDGQDAICACSWRTWVVDLDRDEESQGRGRELAGGAGVFEESRALEKPLPFKEGARETSRLPH